jgi:hypothetical protein
MKKIALFAAAWLAASMAHAQSNPGLINGQVPQGSDWNSYFSDKVDVTNGTLTNPTLTTPNLGTPSFAILTNATGLPISTGVSGLGTGVASLLSGASSGTGGPVGTTSPSISSPTLTGTVGGAADVSGLQATATGGSTARTMAVRFADTVSVLDYGAKCDGITDDQAAINNAVTAAATAGRDVLLPAATCAISASIAGASNVRIIGQGRGSSIIQPTTANATFAPVQFGAGVTNAGLSEITINGRTSAWSGAAQDGIYINSTASHIEIAAVEVYGVQANGINIRGSYNTIRNSYIHDIYDNCIYSTGASSSALSTNNLITGNVVTNCSKENVGATTFDGIDLDPNTAYDQVEGNYSIGNASQGSNDIIVYGTSGNPVFGHQIVGNFVYNSPAACFDVSGYASDIQVSSNHCIDPITLGSNAAWCFLVNGPVENVQLAGNECVAPTGPGLWVENSIGGSAPDNVQISGNSIRDASATSGGYSGILVQGSATNVSIRGNVVIDDRGTPRTAYSIDTTAAANAATVQVAENTLKGNVSGNLNTASGQAIGVNNGNVVSKLVDGSGGSWSAGNLNGVTIGSTTPEPVTATTLTATGQSNLGTGSADYLKVIGGASNTQIATNAGDLLVDPIGNILLRPGSGAPLGLDVLFVAGATNGVQILGSNGGAPQITTNGGSLNIGAASNLILNPTSGFTVVSGGLTVGNAGGGANPSHLEFHGTVPGVTAGTGATIAGNDSLGRVTVGTSPSTTVALTFANAFSNAPACFAQDETTAVTMRATTVSTTGVTFTASGTLTASDKVSYRCSSYN